MVNKRQDIDSFFKENLSEFELSQKKGNWELMRHLLNEQERKKKNRKLLLFIFSLLIILLSGLMIFRSDKKIDEKTHIRLETSHTGGGTIDPSHTAGGTSDNLLNKEKDIPKDVPSIKKEIRKVENNIAHQTKSTRITNNNIQNAMINHEVNHSDVAKNPELQHPPIINSELNLTSSPSDNSVNDSGKIDAEKSAISESRTSSDPQPGDPVNANLNERDTANHIPISSDLAILQPMNYDSIIDIAKNEEAVNSSIAEEATSDETQFRNFNFYAGLNIYNTGNAFATKQNLAPLVVLEYMHPLNSDLTIGVGGWYSLQSGYLLNDTITQETYFFDRMVSQQSIQIHHLHKLYFPLSLYYQLIKNHSVFGALQVSYLLNTVGNYNEINTTSGHTIESQKNNVKGYMDGIKSTNIALSVGYKYRISKRFDVSTRFTRELTGPYVKDYFYGVNSKPSWSSQTILIVKF